MYLTKLWFENLGPLRNITLTPRFNAGGSPCPIVLVGKNGSGKSVILSNIVDAFYESATVAFSDVAQKMDGTGHFYYKLLSGNQINVKSNSAFVYLQFGLRDGKMSEYVYSIGKQDEIHIRSMLDSLGVQDSKVLGLNFAKNEGTKKVFVDKEAIGLEFNKALVCYFPAYRSNLPSWLSTPYHNDIAKELTAHFRSRFNGELGHEIEFVDAQKDVVLWIFNIIVDSCFRTNIVEDSKGTRQVMPDLLGNDPVPVAQIKKNVDAIVSNILGQDVNLVLRSRNFGEQRIAIYDGKNRQRMLVGSINDLSTGQTLLLDIFCSILRQADYNRIGELPLNQISGIVVIDEIDTHLHPEMVKSILPKLLRLFPKVQFIVTAHSPLFVLGMEKEYGEGGYDLYEMPDGNRISAEGYREFQKAFDWLQETRTAQEHQRKITKEAIDSVRSQQNASANDEMLIITEGCTDWKHMEHAFGKLSVDYPELIGKVRFWHYHPKGKGNGEPEFDMGDSQLVDMCRQFAKLEQNRRMVFIADADNPKGTKDLMVAGAEYKNWGHNVYSFQIPNSELRPGFSDVCIEHYYTDEELKTEIEIAGTKRRLFLSDEFDSQKGQTADHKYFYTNHLGLKASKKHAIIDGTSGNQVIKLIDDSEHPVNFALSKNTFASEMLSGNPALANVSVDAFRKIFDVLRQIVAEPITAG